MVNTIIIKGDNGREIPMLKISSIQTDWAFNKIPYAEIKLLDGDANLQQFPLMDSDYFRIGNKITISIRKEGKLTTEREIFSGIVTGVGLEVSASEASAMRVELSDEAIRMTSGRHSGVYVNKKDSDIIKELVKSHNLDTGSLVPTKVEHERMVKNYVSDWDFIISRAEANGLLVLVRGGKLSTIRPELAMNPHLAVDLGIEPVPVFDLKLQVHGEDQHEAVEAIGWDESKKQLMNPVKGNRANVTDDNAAQVAKDMKIAANRLVHPVATTRAELKSWSDAQHMKTQLALVTGSLSLAGQEVKLEVGNTLEVKGIGKERSGKNLITSICHEISTENGWATEVALGMTPDWFSSTPNLMDTSAAGLLPGVNGLQIGVVRGYETDHDRVRIVVPAFDAKQSLSARLQSAYAGEGHGAFFRPEIGDEVIVGFLNDDPRHAVVMGALHNGVNPVPWQLKGKSSKKGIFIQPGYQLLFDEEEQVITLATSDNMQLSIDEKNGSIRLKDAEGSQVEINKTGIKLDSSGDVSISAKANLNIEATKSVTIKGAKIDLK